MSETTHRLCSQPPAPVRLDAALLTVLTTAVLVIAAAPTFERVL